MKYDFDQLIDRDTTHSTKWLKFSDPDVLPMWIADMDFLCPPEVTNPMIERVNQGIFGYTDTPISLTKLFIEHVHKTIGWKIEEDWIVWVPGGVVGLNISCKTVLAPGDIALVPSPIYPPFTEAPENMERGFVKTFLKDINGRLEFDVEDIKELLSDDAKMLYLCNPQNPGGTVFTNRELEDLSALCQENDIIVCSDEIHADLILDDNLKHTPYASLNPYAQENSITIMGPCKTFNLAGFPIAAAIIPNEELREDFERNSKGIVAHIDTMAFVAAEAAYRSAIEWKSELVEYLKTNKSLLSKSINDIEGLSLCGPEAGFLAWIDCRQSGLDSPVKFFVEEARVGVHGGEFFGNEKYVRLNFGCPRSILEEAISRIEKAFSQRK
jgi:cystathionine beta-lyase